MELIAIILLAFFVLAFIALGSK